MHKKYKIALCGISLLLVLFIGISVSYSQYNEDYQNINSEETLVTSDEYLSINYLNGNSFDIKSFSNNDTIVKKISITNVGSKPIFATISIMDINKKTNDLTIKMIDKDNNVIYNDTLGNMDIDLLKTKELAVGETAAYTIYVTYNGDSDNYGMTANIIAYKELMKKNTKTFKELLLNNSEIKNASSTVVGDAATIDEGLIQFESDEGVGYYFRGNVSNNYVNIANMMFRVVRINEDGSIKVVLDNVLDVKSPYLTSISNADDSNSTLYSTSSVRNVLDDFYESNLVNYHKYIVDTDYCSDNTFDVEDENVKYFASYNHIINNKTATFNCRGAKESFKIGLLNIDEVILAGAPTKGVNQNYYLYNPNITTNWWTLSGSQVLINYNTVDMFAIKSNGEVNYDTKATLEGGIRPVLSIDKNTIVEGDGTISNPYTIDIGK